MLAIQRGYLLRNPDNTAWTLEDGYRNILATIGITADGVMRNIVALRIAPEVLLPQGVGNANAG